MKKKKEVDFMNPTEDRKRNANFEKIKISHTNLSQTNETDHQM